MDEREWREMSWRLAIILAVGTTLWVLAFVALLLSEARAETPPSGVYAHYRYAQDGAALPDLKITPGEIDPKCTLDKMCSAHYTTGVRSVGKSEDVEVYTEYGIKKARCKNNLTKKKLVQSCAEDDHLISLQLCGDNSAKNRWPEPYRLKVSDPPGAIEKDHGAEDYGRRLVCGLHAEGDDAHALKLLHFVQTQIVQDWTVLYDAWKAGKTAKELLLLAWLSEPPVCVSFSDGDYALRCEPTFERLELPQ